MEVRRLLLLTVIWHAAGPALGAVILFLFARLANKSKGLNALLEQARKWRD